MSSSVLKFTKMEGLGNDYLYVNCLEQTLDDPPAISRVLSDRHFGAGADGLVLILPASNGTAEAGHFRMRMFNADGSEAEMCGNAIRCVGKYVYERRLTGQRVLHIETLAGEKILNLLGDGPTVTGVRVDMGAPVLRPSDIPVATGGSEVLNHPVEISGERLQFSAVSMGNPHAVFVVDRITDRHVLELGPKLEVHSLFPRRINVEFVEIQNRSSIKMRVWERGSGETLACGTGACAAVVSCIRLGHCDREVSVELLGGTLNILWADERHAERNGLIPNHVYMTGPAKFVFDGTAHPDLLADVPADLPTGSSSGRS